MDYFILGDFDSRNYNMFLYNPGKTRERFLFGEKTSVTERALGQSGLILFDQYYTTKTISLSIVCDGARDESSFRSISAFLSSLGQQKLTLSYEMYKYYEVVLDEAATLEEFVNGSMIQTLKFVGFSPFAKSVFTTSEIASLNYDTGLIYDSGLMYGQSAQYYYPSVTSGLNFDIFHGGNTDFAYPKFIFTGSASSLKVEQFTTGSRSTKIREFNYGSFSGILTVDSDLNNTFVNSIMNNTTFTGQYVSLNGIITPSKTINGLLSSTSGVFLTLDSNASSVDGAYNLQDIYVINKKNCKMEKRKIVNYVGSTRVATVDAAFTTATGSDFYSIYKPGDGINYFRITGTGFSSLTMRVEFRFVYL